MARDDDWHRLIEGDDPNDPLASMKAGVQDGEQVFEALAFQESLRECRAAIAAMDDAATKRALLAAAMGRHGGATSRDENSEWVRRDMQVADLLTLFDFDSDPPE